MPTTGRQESKKGSGRALSDPGRSRTSTCLSINRDAGKRPAGSGWRAGASAFVRRRRGRRVRFVGWRNGGLGENSAVGRGPERREVIGCSWLSITCLGGMQRGSRAVIRDAGEITTTTAYADNNHVLDPACQLYYLLGPRTGA